VVLIDHVFSSWRHGFSIAAAQTDLAAVPGVSLRFKGVSDQFVNRLLTAEMPWLCVEKLRNSRLLHALFTLIRTVYLATRSIQN
jgi:hypothetical protein